MDRREKTQYCRIWFMKEWLECVGWDTEMKLVGRVKALGWGIGDFQSAESGYSRNANLDISIQNKTKINYKTIGFIIVSKLVGTYFIFIFFILVFSFHVWVEPYVK